MRYRILKYNLMGLAITLFALTLAMSAGAAISSGPNVTNSVAAEERRILMFHEAEQSYQEKLKVGKQRYEKKQAKRAKTIEAMSVELQERQKTLSMAPPGAPDSDEIETNTGSWLSPIVAALSIAAFGIMYRRSRLHAESVDARKPKHAFLPGHSAEPAAVAASMGNEVFFCKDSGVNGYGRPSKDGFEVLKGSVGRPSPAFEASMKGLGVIRESGNMIIFLKDHLFATPTVAADALLGKNTKGELAWKTKNGMTLETVQHLQAKLSSARARTENPGISYYKPVNSAAG
jgi:hypothetical protein